MLNKHTTREAWLNALTAELAPAFKLHGAPLPKKIRIAIGFTSSGARGKGIGECWDSTASGDGAFEIQIRPDISDPLEIAAILTHELCHAAAGIKAGHGKDFKKIAVAMGLVGKMKATTGGPEFVKLTKQMLHNLGKLPHARLDTSAASRARPKKQTTRLLKAECEECGYTVRVSKKWLDDAGAPICPTRGHGQMQSEASDDDGEGDAD